MNAALTVPSVTRARPDLRLGVALGLVYVLWGSTYLAMRFAVAALPPWRMAGARYLVAGGLALAFARMRGHVLPSRRDWLLAIPSGILLFVFGNGIIAVAEQSVPSSCAAVVAATSPLVVATIATLRGERPTRAEAAGMALGLVGVLVLTGSSSILDAGWRGALLILAPIGWALGSMMVRASKSRASGLAASAPQMVTGGVAMALISVATGEHLPAHVPGSAVAAWAYLVIAGSLVGFTAFTWLLVNARPAVAMSYAYVNPLVAVFLGAALGGEPVHATALVATTLIAGGVMISMTFRRRTPTPMDRRGVAEPATPRQAD